MSTQPFGYLENQEDSTTGYDNFNAREYNPGMGQFNSQDPMSGNEDDSQTLDPYAYRTDNPFANPDPSGIGDVVSSAANAMVTIGGGISWYMGVGTSEDGIDAQKLDKLGIYVENNPDVALGAAAFVTCITVDTTTFGLLSGACLVLSGAVFTTGTIHTVGSCSSAGNCIKGEALITLETGTDLAWSRVLELSKTSELLSDPSIPGYAKVFLKTSAASGGVATYSLEQGAENNRNGG